eukprot:CAMPEP_0173155610 /NCGR_PEP_ID=MMETSP1105-20130129/14208_1 /TAXON_ID=2985 /ORGANISM="Ochromonas sp., Strain BG-1" /LENGTH=324 /DNA_ID=CAMNT_0014072069 /DNA_START=149 /DNA_END=1123 /DNA_ORIENTATION=-
MAEVLLGTAFKIRPLFVLARDKARSSMIERASEIGVDWIATRQKYEKNQETLQKIYDQLLNQKMTYPDYYLKPFHAYDEGNLSWLAAMEVESAALAVHAQVFPTFQEEGGKTKSISNPNGDFTLRDNFHKNILQHLQNLKKEGVKVSPKRIIDIGCSTGLSTFKLAETFPNAEIIGVDASLYMLAVGQYNSKNEKRYAKSKNSISFQHGLGEETKITDKYADMVSICLVFHELPKDAARNMLQEAYRLLPAGGILTFMDMDPYSAQFQRIASNPFGFAAFKSTEPWLEQYIDLDLVRTLKDIGFDKIQVTPNSSRHRTITAVKV